MPKFCAVFGCSNRSNREKEKNYFKFPKVKDTRGRILLEGRKRRKLWLEALHRVDLTEDKVKHAWVCSDHFVEGQPAEAGDLKNIDYIPSVKLGYVVKKSRLRIRSRSTSESDTGNGNKYNTKKVKTNTETTSTYVDTASSHGLEDERVKKSVASEREEGEEIHSDAEATFDSFVHEDAHSNADEGEDVHSTVNYNKYCEAMTQTALVTTKDTFCQTDFDDKLLNDELYILRETVRKTSFNKESFQSNDKRTKYFTGLPTFKALTLIFDLIEPFIEISSKAALPEKFSHFILTLMKLRLNVDFRFLAYLFFVSESTAARVFYKTLDIMYCRMKSFLIWPTRDQLISSMPECFKFYFGNKVTVIIDCFEIRCQKSSNLEAQATTWSSYKHYNTVKVLIGITPQGSVAFISDAYGGRISDKLLTEDCGILDHLIPGDMVLADRGFLIEEMVALHMAVVRTPAFLKGKKQLDPIEVQETRHTAALRIHVERVIGILRLKYRILSEILPVKLLMKKHGSVSTLDQILVVCSCLINLCPSIIP